ncbi:MAG: Crp/Fnr family transcriptional regulator [Flavobacteriales bacterium]|nr:Crp/Fnr family transcriptional regulator [Flavobacteriales bacterium]
MIEQEHAIEQFYKEYNIKETDLPVSSLELRNIPSREFLFKQNQKANKLYFILKGKVLLGKNIHSKNEQVLNLIMHPSLLGLDSISYGQRYSVYAKSLTPVVYLEMDSHLFNLLYRKNNKLHSLITKQLFSRLQQAEYKYVQLSGNLIFCKRIKQFLIDVFTNFGERTENSIVIQMQITHRELGQYMHASRQSITTTLNILRKESIIDYDRSKIELFCMNKLMLWDL